MNMKKIFQWLMCVLLISASACTHFQLKPKHLLSTCSDATTIVAQQQWQLNYAQQHYFLQVIIERHADYWQWIMLNNLGQRLVTASMKNGVAQIEQHQSHPANAIIYELLEAVQLSYWPVVDLEQQSQSRMRINAERSYREVFLSGILHATINYQDNNLWQGNLTFENKQRNFQLLIESQLLN